LEWLLKNIAIIVGNSLALIKKYARNVKLKKYQKNNPKPSLYKIKFCYLDRIKTIKQIDFM